MPSQLVTLCAIAGVAKIALSSVAPPISPLIIIGHVSALGEKIPTKAELML
jgi:hypothetical protein